MPIKKSDLYSKLWASCDELRDSMDASQPFAPIQIPPGASFADMVALKGKSDIGDQINKLIVRPLEEANRLRIKADFNDDALLGQGKEKVDKHTNLIGIFESKDLDVSRVIAQAKTTPNTKVYAPTCRSGSLLVKVAEAAPAPSSRPWPRPC